jgi:hypothetical protein
MGRYPLTFVRPDVEFIQLRRENSQQMRRRFTIELNIGQGELQR